MSTPPSRSAIKLTNIRMHASQIQSMLDAPVSDGMYMQLWRALYVVTGGDVLAVTLGKPREGVPYVSVQMGAYSGVNATEKLTGAAITATEIAVYLRLESLGPHQVEWVCQELPYPSAAPAQPAEYEQLTFDEFVHSDSGASLTAGVDITT